MTEADKAVERALREAHFEAQKLPSFRTKRGGDQRTYWSELARAAIEALARQAEQVSDDAVATSATPPGSASPSCDN